MKKPKAIRCRIVDVEGEEYAPGIFMRTPPNSQPHVGKLGYAEREYVDVIGYNKKFYIKNLFGFLFRLL